MADENQAPNGVNRRPNLLAAAIQKAGIQSGSQSIDGGFLSDQDNEFVMDELDKMDISLEVLDKFLATINERTFQEPLGPEILKILDDGHDIASAPEDLLPVDCNGPQSTDDMIMDVDENGGSADSSGYNTQDSVNSAISPPSVGSAYQADEPGPSAGPASGIDAVRRGDLKAAGFQTCNNKIVKGKSRRGNFQLVEVIGDGSLCYTYSEKKGTALSKKHNVHVFQCSCGGDKAKTHKETTDADRIDKSRNKCTALLVVDKGNHNGLPVYSVVLVKGPHRCQGPRPYPPN